MWAATPSSTHRGVLACRYMALSVDACNSSNPLCPGGGRLAMWRSPALRGAKADWKQVGPLFTANMTKSGMNTTAGAITGVFVTSDYVGGLRGDPALGATRCVIQNAGSAVRGGRTFWCGTNQQNGNALEPLWDKVGAVGHYDYGGLTMARTVSVESPNQVYGRQQRIVMVGPIFSPVDGVGAVSYAESDWLAAASLTPVSAGTARQASRFQGI